MYFITTMLNVPTALSNLEMILHQKIVNSKYNDKQPTWFECLYFMGVSIGIHLKNPPQPPTHSH